MINTTQEFHNIIKRENCVACNKFILTHNRINTCKKCNHIFHSECSKSYLQYNHLKGQWFCKECTANSIPKYNPFDGLRSDKSDQFDLQQIEDIATISKILNSCKYFDTPTFNSETKMLSDNKIFSILFNNIDGNASNFDTFVSDISQYKMKFSVIAIAETNIDEESKGLYNIPGYESEYNSKFPGKHKGSGLGIYIKNSINILVLKTFVIVLKIWNLCSLKLLVLNHHKLLE